MTLESANIPIPSELIFAFAGYLVFIRQLSFDWAVIAGVGGGLAGSILSYGIGYYGGPPFVARYGKYILLSGPKIHFAQQWFDRYGLITVLLARLLPVVRTFISLPAGFARVNFGKFVLYTAIGSIPWTIALVYAGMLLGENWRIIQDLGHQASLFVVAIIMILAIYFLIRNKKPPSRRLR
jgi:membrane protein DedA with SNARE-associated domain